MGFAAISSRQRLW